MLFSNTREPALTHTCIPKRCWRPLQLDVMRDGDLARGNNILKERRVTFRRVSVPLPEPSLKRVLLMMPLYLFFFISELRYVPEAVIIATNRRRMVRVRRLHLSFRRMKTDV